MTLTNAVLGTIYSGREFSPFTTTDCPMIVFGNLLESQVGSLCIVYLVKSKSAILYPKQKQATRGSAHTQVFNAKLWTSVYV